MILSNLKKIKVVEEEQISINTKNKNYQKDSMHERSNEISTNNEEYNNTIVEFKVSGKVIIDDIIFSF